LDSSSSVTGTAITVYAVEVDDALSNKTFILTPPRNVQTQSLGPQTNQIVDLLRITQTIVITGEITGTSSKTAKQIKDDLKNIYKGVTGGDLNKGVRLVYDGENIDGIIEKLAFNEKPHDIDGIEETHGTCSDTQYTTKTTCEGGGGTWAYSSDYAKYTVQITFVVGAKR
jgi:hypothetical protein